MGHHARMLTAVVAALVLSFTVAGVAQADPTLLRVEMVSYPGGSASTMNAFVPRQAISFSGAPVTRYGGTCGADSAVAALAAGLGDVGWEGTATGDGGIKVLKIKNQAAPGGAEWRAYVDQAYAADPCHTSVPGGSEVVWFPGCTGGPLGTCFSGGPLYMYVASASMYALDPVTVSALDTFLSIKVVQAAALGDTQGPTQDATVTTDEDYKALTRDDPQHSGFVQVRLSAWGNHMIRANAPNRVPVRAPVCATNGQDGFCGTGKPDFNPFITPPSPCATNGHDGQCGTEDTSGPVIHITNIADKQVFKKGKGPGQVKGTIDPDLNGVKQVHLRLSRVSTTRVRIKAKKKKSKKRSTARKSAFAYASAKKKKPKKKPKVRYRTVKRCMVWDDTTAILESVKRCGVTSAKWADTTLSEPPQDFSYGFAMAMPAGTYTLAVESQDFNGYKDDVTPGRNVITFKVL